MKTFHRDRVTGHLRGWNVRLEQNARDAPCVPMRKNDDLHTFGHYRVVPLEAGGYPDGLGRGLLLDYGLGGNARLDPLRAVRDPLVAVNAEDATLLLGWSYVVVGPRRVGTPSFFVLERCGALSHRASPPRG
jgi:hypothetical protein